MTHDLSVNDERLLLQDLAARNILVDEHNICKISDFGMSRVLKLDDHGNDTYETQVRCFLYPLNKNYLGGTLKTKNFGHLYFGHFNFGQNLSAKSP